MNTGSRFTCSFLLLLPFLAAIILSEARKSHAEESVYLLQIETIPTPGTHHKKQAGEKTVSLNSNGDLVIRCGKGTITMAYAPPEDETIKRKSVLLASSDQESPAINGVSLRLSIAF